MNMKDINTWGCPKYVLTSRSQDIKVKKWNSLSILGIYLFVSPIHSSTVSLVYNLNTKNVSPRFHIIFDDEFMSLNVKDSTSLEKILRLYHDLSRHGYVKSDPFVLSCDLLRHE